MTCKVQVFFSASADGWSENYWNSSNDPSAIAAAAPDDLTPPAVGAVAVGSVGALLHWRLAMLTTAAFISHVRISLEGSPFQYATLDYDELSGRGIYGRNVLIPAQAPPAELWSDVIVEMSGGAAPNILHRRMAIRGIPEAVIIAPQQFLFEKSWHDAFQAWFANLTAPNGGWIIRSRPVRTGATDITGFGTSANGQLAYLQPVPAAAPAGPYPIVLRGIKFPHGWNGQHNGRTTVLPAAFIGQSGLMAGNAVQIGPTQRAMVTVPDWLTLPSGTVALYTAAQERSTRPTEAHPVRITSHKVGRPFGLPVGRRRRP